METKQLKELRELCYGMAIANLNPSDVEDYMAIASACARMESRRAVDGMMFSASSKYSTLSPYKESDQVAVQPSNSL